MNTYLQIRHDYEQYSDVARETAETVLETAIDEVDDVLLSTATTITMSEETSCLSDESSDESMDLFEGLSDDIDVKNYCLSADELQISIDSSYAGSSELSTIVSLPNKTPTIASTDPVPRRVSASIAHRQSPPKYAGTFIDPLRLGTHKIQTTYRNICAFSCRSDTWVSVGHITTNIVRCPNLATGRYFCDRCYDVVVRKNTAPQSVRREARVEQKWRAVDRFVGTAQ